MRLHERYVRTAIHMGWRVADHTARDYDRERRGDLLVTRDRERLRVWFDGRGNISDAIYDILWTDDSKATALTGGAFRQVWRASQRPEDNGVLVLAQLEAKPLRTGQYLVGEHVVVLPLDPTKPLEHRTVVTTYYGTAMRHTIALADDRGNVVDYCPLENVRRV